LHFCNAVVKWQTPSAELDGMFRQILQGFRSSLGDQWARIELPDGIKSRLAERYGV
jgi:transportin-1